ncbi:hypothetical protein [Chryseobacterium sp. ERMR1:04]|uniref:hypothetical protein n=1 Tax=Chryseobacterium sp. ERMR1:04 TaxID=1705393 RepID=UPI0006C8D6A0|nr:hypothetical protein [Chryseobacterium sp. ERMR1:04]KPH14212.1 hypothetical protein AMQ68_01435 [Chryseobacterium sp. ERMR1:04]
MKNKLSFLSLFTIVLVSSQQNKTTYFDRSWKETTKDNAAFYRIQETTPIDSIIYNRDFYGNGNLQNQWYSLKNNINERIGTAYWYDENGFDQNSSFTYPNSWKQDDIKKFSGVELKFSYSDGSLWNIQKILNDTHENRIYNENGNFIQTIQYQNHYKVAKVNNEQLINKDQFIEKIFWKNLQPAQEKAYQGNYFLIHVKDFDENGKLINLISPENIIEDEIFNHQQYSYKTKNGFAVEKQKIKNSNISIQQIIDYENIAYVKIGTNFDLYANEKENYKLVYDNYKVSKDKRRYRAYTIIKGKGENIFTQKDIQKENNTYQTVINTDDIKSQSIKKLQKFVAGKVFTYHDKEKNILYKSFFLTPEIFVNQRYRFGTNSSQGFGTYIVKDDDNVEKWRLQNSHYSAAFILNLNRDKPIFKLSDRSDQSFIMTKTGFYVREIPYELNSNEKIDYESVYENFNTDSFYSVAENNGKYNLYSYFGARLLDQNYDSIKTEENFVILQNNGKTEILNSKLEKLPLDNIKSYYIFGDYINVLHSNTAENLDFLGNNHIPFETITIECGTGKCYHDTAFEKKENEINWILSSSISCDSFKTIHKISFENILIEEKPLIVPVLSQSFKYTQGIIEKYNHDQDNWFIAKNGNKYGLYTYNKDSLRDKLNEDQIVEKGEKLTNKEYKKRSTVNPNNNKKKKGKAKNLIEPVVLQVYAPREYSKTNTYDKKAEAIQLLPPEYDEIKYLENEPLIVFRKDNLYGIFLYNKVPTYKKIGARVGNFIEVTDKNDKKGWLDLAANKEYYN